MKRKKKKGGEEENFLKGKIFRTEFNASNINNDKYF